MGSEHFLTPLVARPVLATIPPKPHSPQEQRHCPPSTFTYGNRVWGIDLPFEVSERGSLTRVLVCGPVSSCHPMLVPAERRGVLRPASPQREGPWPSPSPEAVCAQMQGNS